jgi:hypothetical protein
LQSAYLISACQFSACKMMYFKIDFL